jgi:hypothetical protein
MILGTQATTGGTWWVILVCRGGGGRLCVSLCVGRWGIWGFVVWCGVLCGQTWWVLRRMLVVRLSCMQPLV